MSDYGKITPKNKFFKNLLKAVRESLKYKVFAYFLGVIGFLLLVIWIGINFYIEGYYYGKKVENMIYAVDQLELLYASDTDDLTIISELQDIRKLLGGSISIYDDDSVITLYNQNIVYKKGRVLKEVYYNNEVAYVFESDSSPRVHQLLIYGRELYNGKIAMLEIPIESIENSLNIFKEFFYFLVLISIVFAMLFAFVLSRNLSKPIIELNLVAKEMSKLNFDTKYTNRRTDEIGQLGDTLNHLTKKLEDTIMNLTYELQKEKQLDVLRKNFTAQVSHELQTPLTVIKGYIEALQDGLVDHEDERQVYYGIIEDEAYKMSKMVRELLDLSQFEAGTFKMVNEQVDLRSLFDEISLTYEKMASSKKIVWTYIGLKHPVTVAIDPYRFEQGITNIIQNAFKHVYEGGEIRFLTVDKGNEIIITIENDGDHIPDGQLKHIWESFYKAKTSDKKQGTGLGLAIAAGIFKYYHMSYHVYNRPGGVGFELIYYKNYN